MSEQLKPCPFCGSRPTLTVRANNAEATEYFAAVACCCDGYSACAHKFATAPFAYQAEALARKEWDTRADHVPDAGKNVAALELSLKAKTEQLSALHKQQDAAREAIASLESERAANAILTAENEALRDQQRQDCEPFGYFRAEPFGWTDCAETDEGAIALYAAPPKREPLSEEQIDELHIKHTFSETGPYEIDFARAIERAHGIEGQA